MTVESIKHKHNKRAFIPSVSEAGQETDNQIVKEKKSIKMVRNPIVQRGQDPELYWMNKYGADDTEKFSEVDIRSLYRIEHISPEMLIQKLYKIKEIPAEQLSLMDLFGNSINIDELEKVGEYYKHQDNWTNRMILGDSQLVMTSLLEREGLAGKVQTIFFDPPYGIKYGSNWQIKLNNKNVTDGKDEHLSGEPEQIKAYRDTWELGIHSYLSYLRDRLLVAQKLLTESGSCFVQISDENVHLVRCLMDEVFGSANFVSLISFSTTSGFESKTISRAGDYILWYAKDIETVKYRQLYLEKQDDTSGYNKIELENGERRSLTKEEKENSLLIPKNSKIYSSGALFSPGESPEGSKSFIFKNKEYKPSSGHWKTTLKGLEKLTQLNRIEVSGNTIRYVRYFNDFPLVPINNIWKDTQTFMDKYYVVQTSQKIIQRCLLMTTDPGDLVLDPTCGSGTSAYVAEQWGRRWITIDTSRIALNIAKTRLMTASFPYYKLYDDNKQDIRQGFHYKKVPHITLKSLANDEPAAEETLFDNPFVDNKKMRVSGPFTVETLQNYNPVAPDEVEKSHHLTDTNFENRIVEHLKTAGIKNGIKNENAVFTRTEPLSSEYLHLQGFYETSKGEAKAYIHIGPKFGTVSKNAVNESVKECRNRGDADWLIILGFSFESNIETLTESHKLGSFIVTKVRMSDDLMQDGLLKKDKKAASFVTIGEPDITLHKEKNIITVEISGLDIYDPIQDTVKARDVHDIAYWMIDDDYDGSNFIARQVFFCGGDKKEFDDWKKGLQNMASQKARKTLESTIKIEIDDEAFEKLYAFKSHPIQIKNKSHKIAVRVISQFGEECTKVFDTI